MVDAVAREPIKEGPVSVRGHFMWRDRFVVLESGRLTVLRSGKGAVKAKIDLLDPTVRVVFHEADTHFTVTANGHDTAFNCASRAERDDWVSALFTARGNHGGDTDGEHSDLVLSSITEFERERSSPRTTTLTDSQPLLHHKKRGDEDEDPDDSSEYNDTLRAFQDLRSSMMQCNLSLTETQPSPPKLQRSSQGSSGSAEEETLRKRRDLGAIVAFIQTVQHGGRAVLLHLDVIRTVCDISLEEILTAIGERQRNKQTSSVSTAGGLQRLHVAAFVRYILFHPLYAKRPEVQRSSQIDALVDRYFPHCRLRRFSHDLEQGSSLHAFELDLSLQRKDTDSKSSNDNAPLTRPQHAARVAPSSLPKPEPSRLNRKRHSFPNILQPLQIGPVSAQPSIRRMDCGSSSRALMLLQGKRSSSDHLNSDDQITSNNDSDLFQDEIIPEPLRNVLWKNSCQQVAEQLSMFHLQQLTSLTLWGFIHTPKQAAKPITDYFNRLVAYFVWSVLVEDSAKDRAEVIESIITIASIASAAPLSNFHLTMACVGCLGDTPLMPSRLPLTWKRVRGKFKTQLKELRTLCDHTGGFETLRKRQALESSKGSCIPFIGVIGVTLERLRLIPSINMSTGQLDIDKLDRQYVAVSAMESAMLRSYKLHEVDELQDWIRTKMSIVDEFVTPRLLQLRSQHILFLETCQQSGSRNSSLYRSRNSPGTSVSLDSMTESGPPLLQFRDICSILVSTKDLNERIQVCVEALLADERQGCSAMLRKFLHDFKQSACHSACHVVLSSARNCVDAMKRDLLNQKSFEIMQLTGLDDSSIQLERGLYMALFHAVTNPIATWLFTKVKHSFRAEDVRVRSRIQEWLADHELPLESLVKLPSNPMDLLEALAQELSSETNDADTDARISQCVQLLSSYNHPFSVLFLLQQSLDTLFLPRDLRDALELLDGALSAVNKRHLKRISRASASVSCSSGGSGSSSSIKSLRIQAPELVTQSSK